MIIQDIEFRAVDLVLKESYQIAYEEVSHCENVFCRLISDKGQVGWGCAAPDIHVTGETASDVLKIMEHTVADIMIGEDPMEYQRLNELLKEEIGPAKSTRAMVDMAILDLVCKYFEIPLYRYLGAYRKKIKTSITVGILPEEKTLSKVKDYLADGFSIIKLKGGLDLQEDVHKVKKIRQKYGYGFMLIFDANQGYTATQAISFVKDTLNQKIEILEQPCPKDQREEMAATTSKTTIPIMADESMADLDDAFHLAAGGIIDMVNIKLMKVGGIGEATHINSVAKSAKIETMVGCLDESALGISAGLHFALSKKNIHYADLDGHLDMTNDPFKKIFNLNKGWLFPSEEPGLGFVSTQKLSSLV